MPGRHAFAHDRWFVWYVCHETGRHVGVKCTPHKLRKTHTTLAIRKNATADMLMRDLGCAPALYAHRRTRYDRAIDEVGGDGRGLETAVMGQEPRWLQHRSRIGPFVLLRHPQMYLLHSKCVDEACEVFSVEDTAEGVWQKAQIRRS
jgi:hypothetical protein